MEPCTTVSDYADRTVLVETGILKVRMIGRLHFTRYSTEDGEQDQRSFV